MEMRIIKKLEKEALKESANDFIRIGIALFFMVAVLTYSLLTNGGISNNIFLAVAALIGAYMAMNIGANDVANNVGPAVGSKAMTMSLAIVIAAFFEASGAVIAGGDVVKTIQKGIIDIAAFNGDANPFIWAMMSALLAAALWLNFATLMKAPVSTTHSIVGGVMGAGIAAAGWSIVSWPTMVTIAASWIISPILGGIIAALFLYAIKKSIIFQDDKIKAAKKWVPIFVAIMTWAFVTYLTLKGLKHIWTNIVSVLNLIPFVSMDNTDKPTFTTAFILGVITAIFAYFFVKTKIMTKNIENSRLSVNTLFTIPLIFSAALLSFAHGANDVANAVGPLAAINDAIIHGGISSKASIPLWVMLIGGLGIAIGLALYGPKLIKTVGSEITELDQIRAFSVAMAAAITVIIASGLGLPVSSTHIAIGGVFGVGFLREWLHASNINVDIQHSFTQMEDEKKTLHAFEAELKNLELKENKNQLDYERVVFLYKQIADEEKLIRTAKKSIKKAQKIEFVKRNAVQKIIAAWLITVPAAAIFSAALFYMIKGFML